MGCCCVCGRNWCYDIRASCVVVICRLSCPSPVCYVIYLLFAVLVPTASLIGRPWVVLCFLRHEILLLYSVCLDIFLFLCHKHDVISFCSFSEGCSINDIVSRQIVFFIYLSLFVSTTAYQGKTTSSIARWHILCSYRSVMSNVILCSYMKHYHNYTLSMESTPSSHPDKDQPHTTFPFSSPSVPSTKTKTRCHRSGTTYASHN